MDHGFEKQLAFLCFTLGACATALGCGSGKDHAAPNAGPANPTLPGVGFGGSASAGSASMHGAGAPGANGGAASGGTANAENTNGGSDADAPSAGGTPPEASGGTTSEELPAGGGTTSEELPAGGGMGVAGTSNGGVSMGGASGGAGHAGTGGSLGQGGQPGQPSLTAAITDLPATSTGSYTVKWKCTSAVCSNVFILQEAPDTAFASPTSYSFQSGETSRAFSRKAVGRYCYRVAVGAGSNWSEARCTNVTAPACEPGATRCIAGDIQAVETCTDAGWERSECGDRQLCSNKACRTVCGLTSAPANPAICLVPNNDGVNNGEWALWTDSKLAVPTYADGGTSPVASRYAASGQAWPYAWSISTSSMAYIDFKLKQFGNARKQRLTFRAKRAGIIAQNTNNYTVGIFDSQANLVASCLLGPVPYSWGNSYCLNGSPFNSQLDYAGGFNSMALSITGDGFGGAVDLLDVNWLLLTVEP